MKINLASLILLVFLFHSSLFFFGEFLNEYFLLYGIPSLIITLTKIVFISLSLLVFVVRLSKKELLTVFAFLYIPLSSFLFTDNKALAFYYNLNSLSVISFYFLIVAHYRNSGDIKSLAKTFIMLSVTFAIFSFCVDFFEIKRNIPNMFERSYHCGESYSFRWCGVTQNPNLLAIHSAFFLLFSMFFYRYYKNNKIIFFFSMVLQLVLITMSMSRAVIGFLILTFLLYFIFGVGVARKVKYISTFVLLSCFLYLNSSINFDSNENELASNLVSRIDDSSNSVRYNLMKGGLETFYDNPFFGIGYNLEPPLSQYVPGWNKQVDSFYINMLYTQGAFISCLYFFILFNYMIKSYGIENKYIFILGLSYASLLFVEDHFFKTPFFWTLLAFLTIYKEKFRYEYLRG
ncbi:O-antigen ligase family protein [Vibrio navarrensis]|uniref:O-antigen ligase family protein n=1 Tax=Vibrio navarrensis TaxID=29495 RepID=UPI0018DE4013|nr:O-antigen ligase family protein [Vibrio navarrensis]